MERIHKIIAQAGVMSRRKAEEAILQGRVTLNGVVVQKLGKSADIDPPVSDQIRVDGLLIQRRSIKKTFIFYKPRGVVTTKFDPQGRQTVMDFFKDEPELNPIGRLDFESEGLLLLSHDGDLALTLTHPRYGTKKVYEVEVLGSVPEHFFTTVITEVPLEDGPGHFDRIDLLDPIEAIDQMNANFEKRPFFANQPATRRDSQCFKVTVSEGRNRFVRRVFAHFGLQVVRLKRIQMGDYHLDDLKPGERRLVQNV